MTDLTLEQQAVNYETTKHIQAVQSRIHKICKLLLDRAENHDRSKLEPPEVQAFTEETKNLSALTFGTPEYYANLEKIKPTLEHHYANNRHHPQHWKNGIEDMNLVDLVEMFCDWDASSKRHNDGNLRKSIEINAKRFDMPPTLTKILENSMELFDQ